MTNWLSAVMDPLKSAGETAKGLIDIRDTVKFGNAVIELQAQILAAQQGAFTAQARESALAEEVRDLKARMAELETWDAEKQKYQLEQVHSGALAYVLKPEADTGEPPHWLCAACYQHGKKSLLQEYGRDPRDDSYKLFGCPDCGGRIRVYYTVSPDRPAER